MAGLLFCLSGPCLGGYLSRSDFRLVLFATEWVLPDDLGRCNEFDLRGSSWPSASVQVQSSPVTDPLKPPFSL